MKILGHIPLPFALLLSLASGFPAPALAGSITADAAAHRAQLESMLATKCNAVKAKVQQTRLQQNRAKPFLTKSIDKASMSLYDALLAHHRTTDEADERPALLTRDGKTVELAANSVRIRVKGVTHIATLGDMEDLGLIGPKALHAALRTQLRAAIQAAPNARLTDSGLLKAAKEQTAAAHARVQVLAEIEDAKLLRYHHKQVTQKQNPKAIGVELSLGGDEVLQLRPSGMISIGVGGQGRALNTHDLVRLDLVKPAKWKALVARRILELAGVSGEVTDPVALGKARKALAAQVRDVDYLEKIISNPKSNADIAFLLRFRKRVVAKQNGETLHIAQSGQQLWNKNTKKWERTDFLGISRESHAYDLWNAKIEDLARFKITNKAELDAALAKVILTIPVTTAKN